MSPPTYCSTRGADRGSSFESILFAAYASDGGLFVPESLPYFTISELRRWAANKYTMAQVSAEVVHLFTGIPVPECLTMTRNAFNTFNNGHEPPLPMVDVGGRVLLETGEGPTLAFKDIGQQVVAQLLNYFLARRGRHATIIVETSGDTGPAAVAAVKTCPHVSIFCLYPHGRVSPVQELQLTTVDSPNVRVFRTEVRLSCIWAWVRLIACVPGTTCVLRCRHRARLDLRRAPHFAHVLRVHVAHSL